MALLKSVFTVGHLPGYIFITASPINIAAAQKKASTTKSQLPQPIPMQHDEWQGSLDALPWLNHYIPPGSWVIIQDHPGQLEKGKLAYVLGSCQETQHSIVAVIPDQPPFDKTLGNKTLLKRPMEQHVWRRTRLHSRRTLLWQNLGSLLQKKKTILLRQPALQMFEVSGFSGREDGETG